MFNIGGFFKRIQNSVTKEIFVRTVISNVLKKHVGVEVSMEKISIKNNVATIGEISQAARSVIFIKKPAILRDIAATQDLITITDIR